MVTQEEYDSLKAKYDLVAHHMRIWACTDDKCGSLKNHTEPPVEAPKCSSCKKTMIPYIIVAYKDLQRRFDDLIK